MAWCIKGVNRSASVRTWRQVRWRWLWICNLAPLLISIYSNLIMRRMNFLHLDRQLILAGTAPSSERFNRISWGKGPANSEEYSLGLIAGGLVDGNIGLWNPKPLIWHPKTLGELFQKREMEPIVDSDITSAICFLTGICSGSICTIVVAAWAATVHRGYVATLSVLAAFIGYLMTRIAMALPHTCVSCYYVWYAENPDNRLFDKTIQDSLNLLKSGRDVVVPTPRIPRRFTR